MSTELLHHRFPADHASVVIIMGAQMSQFDLSTANGHQKDVIKALISNIVNHGHGERLAREKVAEIGPETAERILEMISRFAQENEEENSENEEVIVERRSLNIICLDEKDSCLKEVLVTKLASAAQESGAQFNNEERIEVKDAFQGCLDTFDECLGGSENDPSTTTTTTTTTSRPANPTTHDRSQVTMGPPPEG